MTKPNYYAEVHLKIPKHFLQQVPACYWTQYLDFTSTHAIATLHLPHNGMQVIIIGNRKLSEAAGAEDPELWAAFLSAESLHICLFDIGLDDASIAIDSAGYHDCNGKAWERGVFDTGINLQKVFAIS